MPQSSDKGQWMPEETQQLPHPCCCTSLPATHSPLGAARGGAMASMVGLGGEGSKGRGRGRSRGWGWTVSPRFLVCGWGHRGSVQGPRSLGGALLGGASEDMEAIALPSAHSRGFGLEREGDESRRGEISRQQCGEQPLSANSSRARKAMWVDANASKCQAPEAFRIPQTRVVPSTLQKYPQFPLLQARSWAPEMIARAWLGSWCRWPLSKAGRKRTRVRG